MFYIPDVGHKDYKGYNFVLKNIKVERLFDIFETIDNFIEEQLDKMDVQDDFYKGAIISRDPIKRAFYKNCIIDHIENQKKPVDSNVLMDEESQAYQVENWEKVR